MRIFHTADWHLGEFPGPVINGENARLMDTIRCIDFLVEKAQEEQPDVILIAGDLFHKSQMWAGPMLNLIDIAVSRLRRLAAIAPTVLMYGTSNHDSLQAFENIKAMQIIDIYVVTTPKLFPLYTKSGPLQVAALPGLDKGHFRTLYPGMDPAEENQKCSQLLGDIVLGMGAELDASTPSVLMAHYTVAGCEYDNGQQHIFTQNEVILPREAIAASPFDLVCLGHIHKDQEVDHCTVPTFYSGAINGLTFNEEGQRKGFWLHEILDSVPEEFKDFGKSAKVRSFFAKTPSREFLTFELDINDIQEFIGMGAGIWQECEPNGITLSPSDKIVRLHYTCSDELNKQLNRKALEKSLYDAGAFYVAEIKPVQINTALSKQELTENAGPLENLRNWCKAEGFTPEDTLPLEILARPLIDTVSAKMPTGKLSGVFVPRRLTVKNYRSYREASFDFDPVTFATVNGPNGVGKSALFMDAISDCLYEETREVELTGWITNGEKSGMITFEFSMGESIWKVIRTRARSGKTTLALQEYTGSVLEPWADRGDVKVRDTQERIIALLGMDAMTFRCCGLIMQDAYGLFLEADREDRMSVLGNILGLGVYEQLEELAKKQVTDTNRELVKARDKLAELDEKLKAKPGYQKELADVGAEIARVTGDIDGKEAEFKEAEELVRILQAKAEKAEDLRRQIEIVGIEKAARVLDRTVQIQRKDKAQKMLAREAEILAKAGEYEKVKELVAALKAKQPQLDERGKEESRVEQDLSRVEASLKRLGIQIRQAEQFLDGRELIEKKAAEYTVSLESLKAIDELGEKHEAYQRQIMAIEKKTDSMGEPVWVNREAIKTHRAKLVMLDDANCIDAEKATCRFLADAIESKAKIPQLEAEIEEIEKQRAPLLEQVKELDTLQKALGYNPEEHYRLKKLVEELRPYSEKAAQLSAKVELLENLKSQRADAEGQKAQLAERLASVKEWISKLSKELELLPAMEARLPKLAEWVKSKDELPAARQIVATATERIAALDAEIAGKEDQSKALETERGGLLIMAADLDTTKTSVTNLQHYIDGLELDKNALHVRQGGLQAKLEALAADEDERKLTAEQMEPLAVTLVQYQTLAKAFGQDGIPFSIVRTVVPDLSAQANEILGQMTGGKMSLEMRTERIQKSNKKEVNALEIFITDYQWGTMPYRSRSGGQKVRAALSVAFALAELKAARAGIRLGMLFVDEPSFLDQQGSEVYVDALETIVDRYTGMKVVAISHDPEMKARFPQVIVVEDGGEAGSKVRLVA
ncbi:MAG: exonuclease subunit SbcD [Bacteroidales bacterium]|nr:exonuclease subunit SbcD [Bacteroidales bacterium]